MNSKADTSTADEPAAKTLAGTTATPVGSWLNGPDADRQGMTVAGALP